MERLEGEVGMTGAPSRFESAVDVELAWKAHLLLRGFSEHHLWHRLLERTQEAVGFVES